MDDCDDGLKPTRLTIDAEGTKGIMTMSGKMSTPVKRRNALGPDDWYV